MLGAFPSYPDPPAVVRQSLSKCRATHLCYGLDRPRDKAWAIGNDSSPHAQSTAKTVRCALSHARVGL